MTATNRNRVSSVERSLDIVEFIQQRDAVTLGDVADRFDLAKSTAHRHLSTLEESGYLVTEGDRYCLSFKFLALGEQVRNRKPVYQRAKPVVEQLADETDERAQFTVEENGYLVHVHTAMGNHAVKTDARLGKHTPLNTVSAGKAILARLPEARAREIIDRRGLPARTENTITDEQTLFEELETVRDRGYALNLEESTVGLRAISVPVAHEDRVIGAFGLSGPSHRLTDDRLQNDLATLLLGVVNEFELELRYQ